VIATVKVCEQRKRESRKMGSQTLGRE
jgi:hypothetical protein